MKMALCTPSLGFTVVLFVVVALAHSVKAGTNLDVERKELGAISSKIEELKQKFKQDLRNRGKNKYRNRRKNSGHRRKKAEKQKNMQARQKKKSMRRSKKVGQRNKFGRRGKKSSQHKRKTNKKQRGQMTKGNLRQSCDEEALCQKIKDFIKISNQLRKVKRIIKVCSLMENKAQKSATEFSATISSLSSALAASTRAAAKRRATSRQTVDDVTAIRDKLSNCTATIQTKCDKSSVEGCQNTTLLTQCEAELKAWTTQFGPAKGSCLQAATDCCACINAIPDVSAQCLRFDTLTDAAVKKRTKCTSGNSEGSFGYCRKLQQEAAVKGPTVAKLDCQTTTTTTNINTTLHLTTPSISTTQVDLTLNVSSLESSVVSLLDTVGNLTTKMEAITTKVDANAAKAKANEDAIVGKCDTSKCSAIEAAEKKLEACLGDVSSSDCPAPPSGKTGVGAIITNTAAIANKCDATKCTQVENKVAGVESCLGDTTSSDCPAAASGKVSVVGAITALETPPVFSCHYDTPAIEASTAVLAPYSACGINVGNVLDKTSGKFTAPKPGKYRFTFMSLFAPENKKKVIAIFVKTTGATETNLARGVAQSKIGIEQEQVTVNLEHIVELAAADTIHVSITVTSPSKIPEKTSEPYETFFMGEFISA